MLSRRCTTLFSSIVTVIAAAIIFICGVDAASNFNTPHSHTGKVTPFKPGDPNIKLDGKAKGILKTGKPYQTQVMSGESGRGLVVQDVDAPTNIVWDRILDYDNYSNMVPKTTESKNYKIIEHKPTKANNYLEREIYTRMKVGFPMLKLEFFIRHFQHIKEYKSLTWTLDYTKESDFDDSCGYWYCVPHPEDPDERTRLYYSVQVSMFDWVPAFVVDFMSKKALTDATAWVKKHSELEWVKAKKEGTAKPKTTTTTTTTRGTKLPGGISMLSFGKKKRDEEQEEQRRKEVELAALELDRTSMTKRKGMNGVITIPTGWQRYLLVSVALVMTMLNLALFFGGDRNDTNQ